MENKTHPLGIKKTAIIILAAFVVVVSIGMMLEGSGGTTKIVQTGQGQIVLNVPQDIQIKIQSADFLSNGDNDPLNTGGATAFDANGKSMRTAWEDIQQDSSNPAIAKITIRTWFALDGDNRVAEGVQKITFLN